MQPIAFLATILWVVSYNAPTSNDYLKALHLKYEKLKSVEVPKVLLLGGSNLAFGINSKVIEKEISRPVVNLGILAGLGLRFMTRQAIIDSDSGDVVLFIPEYFLFGIKNSNQASNSVLSAAIAYPPSSRYSSLSKTSTFYFSVQSMFQRFVKGLDAESLPDSYIYAYSSFNDDGDLYKNVGTELNQEYFDSHQFPLDVQKDSSIINSNISLLCDLNSELRKKNVRLFISFPPGLKTNNYKLQSEQFMGLLINSGLTVLGRPEDYFFDNNFFFNGVSHLNTSGAIKRLYILGTSLHKVLDN